MVVGVPEGVWELMMAVLLLEVVVLGQRVAALVRTVFPFDLRMDVLARMELILVRLVAPVGQVSVV